MSQLVDTIPFSSLNQAQLDCYKKIIEFLQTLNLDPLEEEWLDERGICRFCRARNYDFKKTSIMIKAAVDWRREYRPFFIVLEDVTDGLKHGSNYVNGFDKLGHPTVIMRANRDYAGEGADKLKLIIYNMEECMRRMNVEKGVEKLCYIIDITDFSTKHADSKMAKQWIHILQNFYPERCYKICIVNAPTIFTMFWKVISPFIDKNTRKKVNFVGGNFKSRQKYFLEHWDPDQLEVDYGGNVIYDYKSGQATVMGNDKIAEVVKEKEQEKTDGVEDELNAMTVSDSTPNLAE